MDTDFNITPEEQEEFERYLMDRMPAGERSAFLGRLDREPDLRERFNGFQRMFRAIEEDGLRADMEKFHSQMELERPQPVVHRPRFRPWRIAAAVAALVALGLVFFDRKSPDQKRYDAFYSPDPGLPTVMGSSDNFTFYDAMVDYKQGHYDRAIEKWEHIAQTKHDNDTLNYFLGSAHLAEGEAQESIPYFDKVLETPHDAFRNEAYYYRGLAYLKLGDRPKAILSLEQSRDERSPALLENLKE